MAEAPAQSGSPTRSLRASLHPQARMQQLLAETPQSEPDTEKNTEKNTPFRTEIIAEGITENKAEGKTDSPPSADTKTLTPVQAPRRKAARRDVQTPPVASGSVSVRQRIIEDLQKEPVVRKTIDLPASLAERLQDYCAAKRIKTERRVFLVLLENFLDEEGF